jgi:hypothetical protein
MVLFRLPNVVLAMPVSELRSFVHLDVLEELGGVQEAADRSAGDRELELILGLP